MKKLLLLLFMSVFALQSFAKRNVLFLMADDFNYWTGKNGYYPQAHTPNLDKLANMGVFFRDAHCSSPVCHPSRNALWSGLRPSTTGIDGNGEPFVREVNGLEDIVTMNQYFMQQGYWVYGSGKLYHPGSMDPGNSHVDPTNWSQLNSGGSGCNGGSLYKYCNNVKTNYCYSANESPMSRSNCNDFDLALDVKELIEGYGGSGHADMPFFIGCGVFRPHAPWNSPKYFWDLINYDDLEIPKGFNAAQDNPGNNVHQDFVNNGQWMRAIHGYLASCALADSNIGIMVDALMNSPYKDSTIIVFAGDHGWHLGEKGHWGKFTVDDEANRTTMIIYDPSAAGNGQECVKPVSLQDLYPTLIELCGLPPRNNVEGNSLKALLDTPDDPNIETFALSMYGGVHYIKTQEWRFINDGGNSKLTNNQNDPYQWTNLYNDSQYSDVVAELRHKIDSVIQVGTFIRNHYYDLMPVTAPSGLEGVVVSAREIFLNWTDASNNELGFYIYRQTNSSGGFIIIDSVGADIAQFSDTTVSNTNTYNYYIEAYNAINSAQSNTISGLQPLDLPPAAPTNLSATPLAEDEISLAWQDNSLNEVGFVIYQQTNNTGNFTELVSLNENITVYLDETVDSANVYAYFIKAYNATGNAYSDTIYNIKPMAITYKGTAYGDEPWAMPGTAVLAWNYDKVGSGSSWSADSGATIGVYNTSASGAGQDIRSYGSNCPYPAARWNGGSHSFRENGQWARYTCTFAQSANYNFKLRGRNSNATINVKILNIADLSLVQSVSINFPGSCTNLGGGNDNTDWFMCNSDPINISSGTYVVEVELPSPEGQGIFGEFSFETSSWFKEKKSFGNTLLNTLVADYYLHLDLMGSNPLVGVSIYNLEGKEVQKLIVGGEGKVIVELDPSFQPGMYIISINDGASLVSQKFILQ